MRKLTRSQTTVFVNCMLEFAEKEKEKMVTQQNVSHIVPKHNWPDKSFLMRFYSLKYWQERKDGTAFIGGKMFTHINRNGLRGVIEIPEDGSYIRFISNSWFVDNLTLI